LAVGCREPTVVARPLRYAPARSVVEVTARTVGSRFLLRPDPTTNDLILGVLGRAQHLFRVRVFAVAVMSNHIHALLGVDHAAQLAGFMQHLLGNIAREVGRHHRWSGPFWSRRYRSIVVADDESQVNRLSYVLCQGLKEGLVDRVSRWPGVSSFRATIRGAPMRGVWHDRTAEYETKRAGKRLDPRTTEQSYDLVVSQLPAMAEMAPADYRSFIKTLVRDEERAIDAGRSEDGKKAVLGTRRIVEQDPHAAPAETKRSPAPLVHAASVAVRDLFFSAYRAFVDAFRAAAASLRGGETAEFPEGAFPAPAPFVKGQAAPA
jgi:REP element-mobilizing transposase RayT